MREIYIDSDKLRQLYYEENKTMEEIAIEFKCTKTTISEKFRQYGIKSKSRKINIPKKVLEKRYVQDKESAQSIAKDFNTTFELIYKRLKEYNLPVRGRRIPIPLSRAELGDMYTVQCMTIQQISAKTGISRDLIRGNLKRFNIPIRPDNATKRVNKIPKKDLEDMYVRQGCHVNEIGRKFEVSKYTVYRQLDEYDIPRRNSGTMPRTMFSKETLKRMHVNEKKSTVQISRELNCSEVTIWKKLKEFNIEIRGRNLGKILTKDKLTQLYSEENKSTKEIGNIFNCAPATIHAYLRKFDIPVHRNYSRPEYEKKRQLRKLGLDRFAEMKRWFGDRCHVCGRTDKLSIHHMWYLKSGDAVDKKYTTSDKHVYYNELYPLVKSEPDRFRLLCNTCHKIVGLFQSLNSESRKRMLVEAHTQNQMRIKYPTRYKDLVNIVQK